MGFACIVMRSRMMSVTGLSLGPTWAFSIASSVSNPEMTLQSAAANVNSGLARWCGVYRVASLPPGAKSFDAEGLFLSFSLSLFQVVTSHERLSHKSEGA